MPFQFTDLWAPLVAYLIGAIPIGVLVARAKGVDLFQVGSGNVGATNVGRVLGRPYGILVFVLDFLKGAVPAGLAVWWRGGPDVVAVACGLAAVLGHLFSPLLRFRGGKGVATGAGAVMMLLPLPFLFAVIAFVSVILTGRMMSISSVVAAIVLAIARLSLVPDLTNAGTLFAILTAALVIVRHRTNLARVQEGSEARLQSLAHLPPLGPSIYALTVGLWCGAGWFFSLVVAPQLFTTFGDVVKAPPEWLAIIDDSLPDLGNRLAGVAVAPAFRRYFLWQAVCGLFGAGIALGWYLSRGGPRDRRRVVLLWTALLLVAIGWPITQHVSQLRAARYARDPAISKPANSAFASWHLVSLTLNLTVLALITPALAMAGQAEERRPSEKSTPTP